MIYNSINHANVMIDKTGGDKAGGDKTASTRSNESMMPAPRRAHTAFAADSSGSCGPIGVLREFLPNGFVRDHVQGAARDKVAARGTEGIGDGTPPLGLDFPAAVVGTSGKVTVSYDPALGAQELTLAQRFLAVCHRPHVDMEVFFSIAGGNVQVVIAALSGRTDGGAGAYHYGCDFTSGGTLYLDATYSNATINPLDLLVALFVAEVSECFMGAQGKGWGCGYSNGEGLSRFLAEEETPWGTLAGFQTAAAWVAAGYPDWVTHTELTDRNSVSTSCAILYVYWMRSRGFSIPQIVQAAGQLPGANGQGLGLCRPGRGGQKDRGHFGQPVRALA